MEQALDGKNVKDLLLNVGSGGGTAAVATGGAAAPGGDAAPQEEKKEEKEEGEKNDGRCCFPIGWLICLCREGRVGRGYGLRSVRLKWETFESPYMTGLAWSSEIDFTRDQWKLRLSSQVLCELCCCIDRCRWGTSTCPENKEQYPGCLTDIPLDAAMLGILFDSITPSLYRRTVLRILCPLVVHMKLNKNGEVFDDCTYRC